MSRFALRFHDVHKSFGRTEALRGLTLDVPRGSLLGLIGPNGAGKTTAFGIASGAITAQRGKVDVLGEGPFDASRHAGRIATLPQDCELPPHSSARQLLRFYARLGGQSAKRSARDADRVLELVKLADRSSARVRELSHGMKRRLALAQTLLGEPELILLDEPTGGLDPHLVVEIRAVLRRQRGQRTLVVSSHILADLEEICDHVAFMEAGRCTGEGSVDKVTGRERMLRIRLEEAIELSELSSLTGRDPRWRGSTLIVQLLPSESTAEANARLLPTLLEAGARILEVESGESLEEAYIASRRGHEP